MYIHIFAIQRKTELPNAAGSELQDGRWAKMETEKTCKHYVHQLHPMKCSPQRSRRSAPMPDQLHSSGDVPRFDTYPAPAPEENGREADRQPCTPVNLNVDYGAPAGSGPAAENPHMNAASDQSASNQRPFNRGAFDQTTLNQTAEKIGALIGTAVNIARSVPRQLQSVPGNVASVRDRLRERGEELRQDASEAAHQWRQTAQAKVHHA